MPLKYRSGVSKMFLARRAGRRGVNDTHASHVEIIRKSVYDGGMNVQSDELKTIFRNRLKSRRTELGMSQTALASAIQAQQPYVAALEAGDRNPTLDTLAKLSEALACDPDFFLSSPVHSH